MALNTIIQDVDVESVANVINYNIFVHTKILFSIIMDIKQHSIEMKEL